MFFVVSYLAEEALFSRMWGGFFAGASQWRGVAIGK